MPLETIQNACKTDISVSYWIQFSHSIFTWLMRYPLGSLMLGGLFVIGFLVLSGLLMRGFILFDRGHTIKRLWLWGFPLALFLSVSPLLIGEPLLTQFLSPYDGQNADAVVVLGRGRRLQPSRTITAAALMLTNRAPQIFVSGRDDAPGMATMLSQLGVEPNKISGENCSSTTEENGQYTAQQLLPTGIQSIILVSDPLHLLRAQLVFSSLGFEVIPYPSPLPNYVSRHHRRLLAFRESLGFVAYGLRGRYLPRPIATIDTTAAQ